MAWKMLTGFWNVHEVRERQEAKQHRCAEGVHRSGEMPSGRVGEDFPGYAEKVRETTTRK